MGILMYVAADVPSCQNTIRNLSGRMASPTLLALEGLRHMCKYLLLVREYGMVITKNEKHIAFWVVCILSRGLWKLMLTAIGLLAKLPAGPFPQE